MAQDSVLKGKNLAYIAFGLQYEYQVTLVNRVKELAAEKGMNISVYDGKGDPSTQTTQLLDVVLEAARHHPARTRSTRRCCRAACARPTESNIPLFMLENLPPEGEWVAYNTFDDVAGGAAGADAIAKLTGGKGLVLEVRGAIGSGQSEKRYKGFRDQAAAKYPDIKIETLKAEWICRQRAHARSRRLHPRSERRRHLGA